MSREGSKTESDVEDILDAAIVRQGYSYIYGSCVNECKGKVVTMKTEIRNGKP